MSDVTVTNWDFTPEACRERLTKLLADPPLAVSVSGCAGAGPPQALTFEHAILVSRNEVQEVVRHLARDGITELREALVSAWKTLEPRPEPWACELYRRLSAVLLNHTE